jgi:hypothetical protein
MVTQLPFGMQSLDYTSNSQRGYGVYPTNWDYNPDLQISNQFQMGSSEPTTWSNVSSTGMFNQDSDEDTDDSGTD